MVIDGHVTFRSGHMTAVLNVIMRSKVYIIMHSFKQMTQSQFASLVKDSA